MGRSDGNEGERESPQETAALREDRGGGDWRRAAQGRLNWWLSSGSWLGPQETVDSVWTHSVAVSWGAAPSIERVEARLLNARQGTRQPPPPSDSKKLP